MKPLKKIKQFSPGMRRQRGTISSRWRGSKPMQGGWRRWKRVFLSSKWKSGKNGGFPTTIPTFIPLCSQVLSWEDPFKSTYALVTYILMVFYMEPWALPILPLLLLLFHWFHRKAGAKSSADIFLVSAVNLIFTRMWGEGGGKVEVWRGALRGWGRKWGGRGGGRLAHCRPGENGGEECLLDAGGELWVQFAVFKCLHLTPDFQVLPKIGV